MLPRSQRLHTAADFRRMRGRGQKWQSPSFIGLSIPSSAGRARLGVIVSAKIGKAVVRKRASRVLRSAFRQAAGYLDGFDIVLIARPVVKQKTSREVAFELERMGRFIQRARSSQGTSRRSGE